MTKFSVLLFLFLVVGVCLPSCSGSEEAVATGAARPHHTGHHKHASVDGVEALGDMNRNIQSPTTAGHYERARRLLHSGRCEHVYLDLGSNIGIQIRKLYEPQYYPGAAFLKIYNEHFGVATNTSSNQADVAARSNVCAFGFEPNPHFVRRLAAIEESYSNLGFPIVMFTETAIGITPTNVSFFLEPTEKAKNHEWGASMLNWHKNMTQVTAGSVVLSDFIHYQIKNRKGQTAKSKLIMKMDVEGMEFTILPDMLVKRAICDSDMIMCEFHKRFVKDSPSNVTAFMEDINFVTHKLDKCKGKLITIDDESYGTGDDLVNLPGRKDSAMDRRLTGNGQVKLTSKMHFSAETMLAKTRTEVEMMGELNKMHDMLSVKK